MSVTDSEASESIQLWAQKLMRGHKVLANHAPLSAQHFKQLCSIPAVRSALLQASTQVATPAHCRHVRLNLQLARLRKSWSSSDEDSSTESPREVLARRRAAVVEAEATVAQCASQLAAVSHEVSSLQHQASSWQQRRLLVECVGAQLTADTRACHQLQNQLQQLLQRWTRALAEGDATAATVLAAVEEGVTSVQRLRRALMEGKEQQEHELHDIKVSVWALISDQGRQHGSRGLLAALTRLCREETAQLHRNTAQIDLRADAALLKLQATEEGGPLRDAEPGSGDGVLHGLKQLLCLMCGAHIEAQLRASRLHQAATAQRAARDSISNSLQLAIKHKQPDAGSLASVNKLVSLSITAAGERAALDVLHAVAERLQQSAARSARELETLLAIHARIHSFEATVRSNTHQLKCLSISIEQSFSSLGQQAGEARSAAATTLTGLPRPSTALPPLTTLTQELHLLSALPMDTITSLTVKGRGRVLERDVSINVAAASIEPALQQALDQVVNGASSALSVESVCAAVCKAHTQVCALNARARHAAHTHAARRSNTEHALATNTIKELCREVDESDERLEAEVLAVLGTCSQQLQRAHEAVPRIQDALDTWWEQPAKNIKL